MSLLEEPNIVFEQAIWSAFSDFVAARPVKTTGGMRSVDLADVLIVSKARMTAHDRYAAYEGTYTFDRAAMQIKGTKTPSTGLPAAFTEARPKPGGSAVRPRLSR
jgi:hypothetical protein